MTVTRRGGPPGEVRVLDGGTRLVIAGRPGNRRVDSMRNLLHRNGIGVTFRVRGVAHVLRVQGHLRVVRDGRPDPTPVPGLKQLADAARATRG